MNLSCHLSKPRVNGFHVVKRDASYIAIDPGSDFTQAAEFSSL